jgi:hypothetical protein
MKTALHPRLAREAVSNRSLSFIDLLKGCVAFEPVFRPFARMRNAASNLAVPLVECTTRDT